MGSSRKRAKLQLSTRDKEISEERSPVCSPVERLAADTSEFNQGLGDIRRSHQSIPRPAPRIRRKSIFTLDEYWQLPYPSSQQANNSDDQQLGGKRFVRVKEFANVQYEVREKGFVCPGCYRELPVSRRFARKMCQACYKRYLRAHQGEVGKG